MGVSHLAGESRLVPQDRSVLAHDRTIELYLSRRLEGITGHRLPVPNQSLGRTYLPIGACCGRVCLTRRVALRRRKGQGYAGER